MTDILKRLFSFGRKGDTPNWFDTDLYDAKHAAFEERLGKAADEVVAAIIGWGLGGPVDLWVFPNHDAGTWFTTMQLAVPGDRHGPKRNSMGRFELAAATRRPIDRSPEPEAPAEHDQPAHEQPEPTPYECEMFDIRAMLSNVAYYSFQARLEPNQTAELPAEDDANNVYLIFDALASASDPVVVLDENMGILLCIRVHKSELEFAREHGTHELIERLKAAGHYPYCDLDRPAVA